MSEQHQSERRSIQGIDLLKGEELALQLDGREGLVREPIPRGDLLLMTNLRMVRLAKERTRESLGIAYLEDIDNVEITTPSKNSGLLVTGGLLILAGVLAGILVNAFGFHLLIALATAGALGGLGIISSSKYFIPEEPATLLFRIGASEIALPLRSQCALRDAYFLVNHLFMLRAGHHPLVPTEEAAVTRTEEQLSPALESEPEATPTAQASPSLGAAFGNPVEADVIDIQESAGWEQDPNTWREEADHRSDQRTD